MLTQEAEINLGEALSRARTLTDEVFALVRSDSLYERPIAERHRMIFYLGHLEAFDWNQVCGGVLGMRSSHAEFDRLFAFGIDPREGDLPDDQPSDWPSVEEVQAYNRRVREEMDKAWRNAPDQMVHVAIEHRLMHAETFAYMLHNLPYDRKIGPRVNPVSPALVPPASMVEIPAGSATLGRPRNNGFGWDNEFEEHTVEAPAFAIQKRKVTNGEYMEFVRAGANPPYFWTKRGEEWFYRGMFGETPLPLDWPVYVTYYEAAAYADWKGKSLPTEAQFHRAAYGTPGGAERSYPWGEQPPDPTLGNFDFQSWDPVSVGASPAGDSAFGVSQLIGNGWEWTSTVFQPFPGFEPFPFYPGYSANFFDGAHYVIKGGSARTAACMLRRSFRNWFRPRYPYVYAGFRLVES
jgi:formylglycine-generating enzyme required for sulfatase activity